MLRKTSDSVEDYIANFKSRGRRGCSVVRYRYVLNSFLKYCEKEWGKKRMKNWSRADVINFKWHLTSKFAPITVNFYLVVLREFFRYLEKKGICKNLMQGVDNAWEEKKIPSFVGDEELSKLFELTDSAPAIFVKQSRSSGMTNARDIAIFEIIIGTGITSTELCEIKLSDINLNEGFVIVAKKNKGSRIIPLPQKTLNALKAYSEYRKKIFHYSPYYFLYKTGAQFNISCVHRVCKKFLEHTTSKKKGPQTLRNTYINTLSQRGANLQDVKYLSGQVSIQNMMRFANLSTSRVTRGA